MRSKNSLASAAPGGRASPSANSPGIGDAARPHAGAERLDVVGGAAQLDLRAEQRPVRGRRVGVRHADAAGVDEAGSRRAQVELDVRVPEDDRALRHAGEHRRDALLGRERRDDVLVAARRGVAEEHVAEPVDLDRRERRQRAHPLEPLRGRARRPPSASAMDQTSSASMRALPASSRSRASTSSRSPLPRIVMARSPRARTASTVSHGNAPPATSPPTTIRSTPSVSISARTAASAASFPWMS